MRIISPTRLKEFWAKHRDAENPLTHWYDLTRHAAWQNPADVRRTFGPSDFVRVASGKSVAVFDIGGNKYRLIAAIHYDKQTTFVLRVLTHREYDKRKWIDEL